MKEGYVKSSHYIHWLYGKPDESITSDFIVSENSFLSGFFKGYHRCGHFCPECKKIILSLEE